MHFRSKGSPLSILVNEVPLCTLVNGVPHLYLGEWDPPYVLQVKGSPPLPPSGEKSPFSILLLSLSLKSLSSSSFILIFFTFKDGGLLTNSPCALAIHEAKLVWPATPLQCVVSLGTGIYYNPSRQLNSTFSSLREKLLKVVASATDTEGSSYSPSP